MTETTHIILIGDSQRDYAKQCIDSAPANAVVTIKEATRSLAQNAKMWAMLNDVRKAIPEGRRWTSEQWKSAFMYHLGHEIQFCEQLEGGGYFPLGMKSSNLSIKEMSDLIEVMYAYGSQHNVKWNEAEKHGIAPCIQC